MENYMNEEMDKKARVVLGMSGGTDSSVAAMMLKEQGYHVIGVSLWFFSTDNSFNPGDPLPDFIVDAQKLAQQLGLEHHVIDARREFRDTIIQFFLDEYMAGRTPSPCIQCNPQLKWKLLLEKANELNCEFIATGHYIQICKESNGYYICKGKDPAKDQSYFLWNLGQDILSRTLTPLGKYTKTEVREIAGDFGFQEVAKKKESMGICFMDRMDYRDFLQEMIPDLDQKIGRGNVTDTKGNHLGWHDGYPYYTIGQKRGLDLKEKSGLMVSRIDARTNTLILEKKDDLNRMNLKISNYYFNDIEDSKLPNISTIVRGLGLNPQKYSSLQINNDTELEVKLEDPAWAIAPGQPVAFYIGDKLIGGGFAE
ncbi:tRNA 2-thiouridine(34) synthase MnmA [Labilibaculum manganireducens]|uniref:tRNA-specific 2-thiouridylase MnmA n=1 Tax=Labilibaculum manganireducens TaxID=1940525 RepID=A0A2N3IDN2_9BACT|nr:tRNA 2-thiouridine(34) synthase MnmA [Labilibaculum manganireducens]PKQ68385.1 tRNA 2-thiouridine(34) synthase MnmA [Labilibaculum manganireducens]